MTNHEARAPRRAHHHTLLRDRLAQAAAQAEPTPPETDDDDIPDEDQRLDIARHEACHAVVAHHLGWTVNEVQVIVDTDVWGNTERWAPDGLAEANEFFDSMVIDLAALAAGCEFSGLFDDVQNLWDNARRLEVLQRELRDAPEQAEQRDPDHLTDRPVAELVTEAFHRARLTLEGHDDEVEAVQSRLLAEGKLPRGVAQSLLAGHGQES